MQQEKSGIIDSMLDFLFPPLCLACGNYESSGNLVCAACDNAIDVFTMPFCLNCGTELTGSIMYPACCDDGVVLIAYGNYRPVLREIILQFKFRGITKIAAYYIPRLYREFKSLLHQCEATCLVPIPLHPGRERQRGYNQALILADELGVCMDVPVKPELLFRIKRRPPQARLEIEKRLRNVQGVFAVGDETYTPERILLVDDVVTTGATAKEAKATLESVGHTVVGVVALAHGV